MDAAELMRCKHAAEAEAAKLPLYSEERQAWLDLSADYWRRIVALQKRRDAITDDVLAAIANPAPQGD